MATTTWHVPLLPRRCRQLERMRRQHLAARVLDLARRCPERVLEALCAVDDLSRAETELIRRPRQRVA
jgi:hypothetical protein